MLRRHSQYFGELPVVLGSVAIQGDGSLGKLQRSGVVAEGVANLREEEVDQRVAGRFAHARLDDGARPLPVACFDQAFGRSLLGPAHRRRREDTRQWDCDFGFHYTTESRRDDFSKMTAQ